MINKEDKEKLKIELLKLTERKEGKLYVELNKIIKIIDD